MPSSDEAVAARDRILMPWDLRPVKGIDYHRDTLRKMVKAGTFPAPVQLSPYRVGWRESDIDGWLASRPVVAQAPRTEDGEVISFRDNNRYPAPVPTRSGGGRPPKAGGVKALTAEFNQLVDEATAAGRCPSWARHHASDFVSKEVAEKKLARLRAELTEAG